MARIDSDTSALGIARGGRSRPPRDRPPAPLIIPDADAPDDDDSDASAGPVFEAVPRQPFARSLPPSRSRAAARKRHREGPVHSDSSGFFGRTGTAVPAGVNLALVGNGIALENRGYETRYMNPEGLSSQQHQDHVHPPNYPDIDEDIEREAADWQKEETDRLIAWAKQPTVEFINEVATAAFTDVGQLVTPSVSKRAASAEAQRRKLGSLVPSFKAGTTTAQPPAVEGEARTALMPLEAPPARATAPTVLEGGGGRLELPAMWTSAQGEQPDHVIEREWAQRDLAMLYTADPRSTQVQWLHEHFRGAINHAHTALLGSMTQLGNGVAKGAGFDATAWRLVGLRYFWHRAEKQYRDRKARQPYMQEIINEIRTDIDHVFHRFLMDTSATDSTGSPTGVLVPLVPENLATANSLPLAERPTDDLEDTAPAAADLVIDLAKVQKLGHAIGAKMPEYMVPVQELICNSPQTVRTLFAGAVGKMLVAHRLNATYGGEPRSAEERALSALKLYITTLGSKLYRCKAPAPLPSDGPLDAVDVLLGMDTNYLAGPSLNLLRIPLVLMNNDVRWELREGQPIPQANLYRARPLGSRRYRR